MNQPGGDNYSYENPYMQQNTEKVNIITVRDPSGFHQYRNGLHMSFNPPDPPLITPPHRPSHPPPRSRSRSRASEQPFSSGTDAPAVPHLPPNHRGEPYPALYPQKRLGVTLPANGPFRPEYQSNYRAPDPVPRPQFSVSNFSTFIPIWLGS